MNIELHIERLVLDGVPIGRHQHGLLGIEVEAELTRLLARGGVDASFGLRSGLRSGGTVPSLSGGTIPFASRTTPASLGRQIAVAVHGAMTRE